MQRKIGVAWPGVTAIAVAWSCGLGSVAPPRTKTAEPGDLAHRRAPSDAQSRPSADAGHAQVQRSGPVECHAIESPAAIDRRSRVSVLNVTSTDLGHIYGKLELALLVARRAVEVADHEGSKLEQAEARLALGAALAASAHLEKTSLAPALRTINVGIQRLGSEVGKYDRRMLHGLLTLAGAKKLNGAYVAAMGTYREALDVARAIDGANPCLYPSVPTIGDTMYFWCEGGHQPACALWEEVRTRDYARTVFDGGCEDRGDATAKEPSGRRWTLALEALELLREGNLADAETFARVETDLVGPQTLLLEVEGHLVLAHVLSRRGAHREAGEQLKAALNRLDSATAPNSALRAHVLLHSAAAQRDRGEDPRVDLHQAFEPCNGRPVGDVSAFLERLCSERCPAACALVSQYR